MQALDVLRNSPTMRRWKIIIFVFLLSALTGGAYVYSRRDARNGDYEFCTTRAYGWPFATRIDHCECDGRGGLTEHLAAAKYWNAGAVLLFAEMMAGCVYLLPGRTRCRLLPSEPVIESEGTGK